MRARAEIQEDVAESAENNGVETIRLLQLEVLLDIRDLLGKQPCPDCCYVIHGAEPSDERLRLGR